MVSGLDRVQYGSVGENHIVPVTKTQKCLIFYFLPIKYGSLKIGIADFDFFLKK